MTRDQWEKMKEIFSEALERAPAERVPFVRESAKDDPELLGELLRLLEESDHSTALLSQPAVTRGRPAEPDEGPRFSADTILARRFRIVRFIARGGMGEVYEAEDLELGERVALKAIRRRVAPDDVLLVLFKKEIQLARHVTHPNVCRIFDLAQHEEAEGGTTVMLLSMELLQGRTLSDQLDEQGPMSFRDALPLIEEIAAGLQAIHDAGIIHGDLKPGNVMLAARPGESRPRAVVMDFGMAHQVTPDSGNRPVSRGGTPEYYAPEQAQGAPLTTAADVYSFALVIAEMLGVPRPARLQPDAERMPSRWARLLRRCLDGEPSRRYSRPAELATALRRSADYRRRTAIRVAAAALVAGAGFAAAMMIVNRPESVRGTASRLLLEESDSVIARSPSPDGRSVAMASLDTGDLVLRDVNSGATRRLTHREAQKDRNYGGVYRARFSPDGRLIAYQWMNSRTESELRLIGADGSGERTVYHQADLHPNPIDWSPDSSRLLVELTKTSNPEKQFGILNVSDGSVRFPAIPKTSRIQRLLFAADGNGIIFSVPRTAGSGSEIHYLSASGEDSILIPGMGTDNDPVAWYPDHRKLIYSSNRLGRPGIWSVLVSERRTEGEPRELVPDANHWEVLGVTRTGSIFYRLNADTVDIYTAILDLAAGRTISAPQPLMDGSAGSHNGPHWSEDGRRVVFSSPGGISIYELQTGLKREFRFDFRYIVRPQWVEHGASIMALGVTKDGQEGQFRIDPKTGKATLFRTFQDLDSGTEGAWSADGRFHYNRYRDFRRGLFRLDTKTGERRVLYVPPSEVDLGTENLALSPDGRMLAFHARNDRAQTAALMLLPAEGGTPRTLMTIRQPETFLLGAFSWTPDSSRILVSRTTNNRFSEIWQAPMDGTAPAKIDFPPMSVGQLRLNPDGKTIAFVRAIWRSEIWVRHNVLTD